MFSKKLMVAKIGNFFYYNSNIFTDERVRKKSSFVLTLYKNIFFKNLNKNN